MGAIMTNEEKIYVVTDRINNFNNLIIWLENNPSLGEIPEGKLSTEEQKNNLILKRDALLNVLSSLQQMI